MNDPYAKVAADCALACYGPETPHGLTVYHSGAIGWIQFDIYESDNLIVIAFDGSNQGRDWWRHLHVKRVPLPYWMRVDGFDGATAHGGWLEDAMRVFPTIAGCVAACRYRCKDARILVTGHSYGGALALATAIPYAVAGKDPILRTFGAPAFGNKKTARMVDAIIPDHVRYACPQDAVTKVPVFNTHCGKLVKTRQGWPAHSMTKYHQRVIANAAPL